MQHPHSLISQILKNYDLKTYGWPIKPYGLFPMGSIWSNSRFWHERGRIQLHGTTNVKYHIRALFMKINIYVTNLFIISSSTHASRPLTSKDQGVRGQGIVAIPHPANTETISGSQITNFKMEIIKNKFSEIFKWRPLFSLQERESTNCLIAGCAT